MIYLDNAATTYPKPEVVYKAMDNVNRNLAFNAGRGHYQGANEAFDLIERARKFLCEKANAPYLTFTPSATHALNQIVSGIDFCEGDVVYCSPYDHNAIARTLHAFSKQKGFELKLIPLNEELTIDLETLDFKCTIDKPRAIFCTHVSNVTGYILPVQEIGVIAKKANSIFVVDGAQAFGLVPVDLKQINADYYVFAGHKTVYGPFGVGGYFSKTRDLKLSIFGGTGTDSLNLDMPKDGPIRFEPASPNITAIAGLYEGAKWTFDNNSLEHERNLYKYAVDNMKDIMGITLYEVNEEFSTGILSFNLDGFSSEEVAEILANEYDISVRGGYHCCPFIHEIIKTKKYLGTIRVSFNAFNTKEDIDVLCEALDNISFGG